ncbi:lipid kinase [Escherichia coli]|uniref:Lipid kinase n=1 Tax=Escherichia coli TaxID=562 RepID=A0A484X5B4_ECOLX|nr:lipid kinase [Escherichia coli]
MWRVTWGERRCRTICRGGTEVGRRNGDCRLGGDGTINEVSTALIQCEGDDIPALGILPLGTANDFATSVRDS